MGGGVVAAAFVLLVVSTAPARAERAAAIAAQGAAALLTFDTGAPAVATLRRITGLAADESIAGIDVRPATGQLYALAVATGSAANSRITTYVVDPDTGVATPVGQTAAPVPGVLPLTLDKGLSVLAAPAG